MHNACTMHETVDDDALVIIYQGYYFKVDFLIDVNVAMEVARRAMAANAKAVSISDETSWFSGRCDRGHGICSDRNGR